MIDVILVILGLAASGTLLTISMRNLWWKTFNVSFALVVAALIALDFVLTGPRQ